MCAGESEVRLLELPLPLVRLGRVGALLSIMQQGRSGQSQSCSHLLVIIIIIIIVNIIIVFLHLLRCGREKNYRVM